MSIAAILGVIAGAIVLLLIIFVFSKIVNKIVK